MNGSNWHEVCFYCEVRTDVWYKGWIKATGCFTCSVPSRTRKLRKQRGPVVFKGLKGETCCDTRLNKVEAYSRCQALVSQDLHGTVPRAFIFMCFKTLQRENQRRCQMTWVQTRTQAEHKRKNRSSSVPASGSWWHLAACSRTHWLLLLWLRRLQSTGGWWFCRGYHLVKGQESQVVAPCFGSKSVLWC